MHTAASTIEALFFRLFSFFYVKSQMKYHYYISHLLSAILLFFFSEKITIAIIAITLRLLHISFYVFVACLGIYVRNLFYLFFKTTSKKRRKEEQTG